MFNTYKDIDWNVSWVYENSRTEALELIDYLNDKISSSDIVAFDFETTKIGDDDEKVNPLRDDMYSVSFCFDNYSAYAIRINSDTIEGITNVFNLLLDKNDIHKIIQNLKFDMKLVWRLTGRTPKLGDSSWEDTMLQGYLVDENRSSGLKKMVSRYLNIDGFKYETRLGDIQKIGKVDWIISSQYNCADSWFCFKLFPIFKRILEEQGLINLYENLYKDLSIILLETEIKGFRIDREYLEKMSKDLELEVSGYKQVLNKIAGFDYNPKSPDQTRKIFNKLCLDKHVNKKTKKKKEISTDKEVLESLQKIDKSGFVDSMLKHREKITEKQYVDGVLKRSDENDICRSNFLLIGTKTGRFSSKNPNFQNLKRGRYGIRYGFMARPGKVLVIADFNQTELRILADHANDDVMLDVFKRGGDIHSATAIICFDLDCLESEVKKKYSDERSRGKTVNFALIYGEEIKSLAEDLGCSVEDARIIYDKILRGYDDVVIYKAKIYDDACNKEYVTNVFGRRRRFPGLGNLRKKYGKDDFKVAKMLREAFNAVIQGTGVDITNIAIKKIKKKCQDIDFDAVLLAQVHDEMIFEIDDDEDNINKFIGIMESESKEIVEGLDIPLEYVIVKRWGEKYE